MTKKEATRAIGELLDSYQAVLNDIEKRSRFEGKGVISPLLAEEDWQIRDASIARIDATCHVLELLNYTAWRGADGSWIVQ